MSQPNPDLEKYRGTAGAEVKTANVSGDDHALKGVLGDDDSAKERIYDPKLAGERFVQFYDDSAAAIREYLSNAETACIRRARHELLNAGFDESDIPDEVTEMLELAKEEAGYEPIIEVTYNRKPDSTRFIIEDNGIGISTEEYQVVQRIGYSTSHAQGNRLGNFGMGWMSGFQLTSVNGLFKMYTKSYLTNEAYGTVEYVANCEFLDVAPTEYGTRFEFPAFGEEGKQIDIPSKVRDFAEGMRITVLYRDFDSDGNETHMSDDFLPTNMEEDYDDDAVVIIAENEFFKAVMSPDSPSTRRGYKTYNITMPIRRNTNEFGSEPKFDAPWQWDFRGKREDGPIVACPSDESFVGLIPKEDSKYERLLDDLKEKCVPMSEVPDDAIVMPDPASSRDSYKSGHDDFWQFVSEQLKEGWAEIARKRLTAVQSWDDFLDMDREEKNGFIRAYKHFGPSSVDMDPDDVQEYVEESLDITVPTDVLDKLQKSRHTVRVVRENTTSPNTNRGTYTKAVWKVIDESDGDVYMGKSINNAKMNVVRDGLDASVVRLDSGQTYTEFETLWGWKKLKDVKLTKLDEQFPNLDDDLLDRYKRDASTGGSSGGTASTGGNGKNPKTYYGKVRVGTNSRKYFSRTNMEDLVELLEDDEHFKAGAYRCRYVIICDDDMSAREVAKLSDRHKDVAALRLPEYVYDYMVGKKNVYESMDEIREEQGGATVELSDGTTGELTELPETDMLIATGSATEDYFEDKPEDFAELLGYDPDDYERYTFVDTSDFTETWGAEFDATFVVTKEAGGGHDLEGYDYHKKEHRKLVIEYEVTDIDTSSDEYKAMFGYRSGNPRNSTHKTLTKIAIDADIDVDGREYDVLFERRYGHPSDSKIGTLVDIAKRAGLN